MASLAAMMSKQRDARLARDAQREAEKASRFHGTSAPNFWDNINTSGGLDACHMWEGATRWNHPSSYKGARYESPVFEGFEGCDSDYANRVVCFATYGRNVPQDYDVSTICGERLCVNLRHLAVVKHGGCGAKRDNTAVPVAEFFCEAVNVVDVLRDGGFEVVEVVEGAENVLKMIRDAA